jgi:hypothetical protein
MISLQSMRAKFHNIKNSLAMKQKQKCIVELEYYKWCLLVLCSKSYYGVVVQRMDAKHNLEIAIDLNRGR